MTEETVTKLTARIDELELGDGKVLRLSGEIDIATVSVFQEAFETLAETQLSDLIIDATEVTFIDSTGLHALIAGKRLMHGSGVAIVLVVSPQVRRVLEVIFPEPLFAARVDTMEEALAILRPTHGGIQAK